MKFAVITLLTKSILKMRRRRFSIYRFKGKEKTSSWDFSDGKFVAFCRFDDEITYNEEVECPTCDDEMLIDQQVIISFNNYVDK